jgi:hypothetical protein
MVHIILTPSINSQVRIDVGIADHVWQKMLATIAKTVDALGDMFKPELQAG